MIIANSLNEAFVTLNEIWKGDCNYILRIKMFGRVYLIENDFTHTKNRKIRYISRKFQKILKQDGYDIDLNQKCTVEINI